MVKQEQTRPVLKPTTNNNNNITTLATAKI